MIRKRRLQSSITPRFWNGSNCNFSCPELLSSAADSDSQLFPVGFVEETLNTLALLFPSSDPDIEQWSRKLTRVDSMAFKCGRLRAEKRQIENFRFWHDELVILKQVFDQSQPSSFEQFWNDRRNGVQWYTFWVAFLVFVLTLVFGLIQCIEGALQVYKAYHPSFQV